MTTPKKTIKQTVYLKLDPSWSSTWHKEQGHMPDQIKLMGATKTKPEGGSEALVIAIELELDEDIFEPIKPSAAIKIERDRKDEEAAAVVVGHRVKSKGAPSVP
jgi:hypothetical protein